MAEALMRAVERWPYHGIPEKPAAWLATVAINAARDSYRRSARSTSFDASGDGRLAEPLETRGGSDEARETLDLIVLCCDPLLSRPLRIALALDLLGENAATIARRIGIERAAAAQRMVRAKGALRERARVRVELSQAERAERRDDVLAVLHVRFAEGFEHAHDGNLAERARCEEALTVAWEMLYDPLACPGAYALVALMELSLARLGARFDTAGALVRLEDQDRSRWDAERIARGARCFDLSLKGDATRYHHEAAIALAHATAPGFAATNWLAIVHAYDELLRIVDTPLVRLQRAVAVSYADGPAAALPEVEALSGEPLVNRDARFHAARGEMLARLGRRTEACAEFRNAAQVVRGEPRRAELLARAAALDF